MNRCLLITIILYNSFPRAAHFADREKEERNFFLPLNFPGVQFCPLSEKPGRRRRRRTKV